MIWRNFMHKKTFVSFAGPVLLASAVFMAGCTTPTGTVGKMSYFTEGVITDIEVIDVQKNNIETGTNTGLGAAAGAIAGQAIGRDSKGTLIGAGIGAAVGFLGSKFAESGDGMRLTVNTDNGLVLIDQPYSCLFKINSKVRMINNNGSYQLQVFDGTRYRTAVAQSKSECPLE